MGTENRRLNITALAKQFETEGFKISTIQPDPLSRPYNRPQSREGNQIFNDIKPELFALLSLFTDRIVDRAYRTRKQHNPFGLIEMEYDDNNNSPKIKTLTKLDNAYPFRHIGYSMKSTLENALTEEVHELKDGIASPSLQAAYARVEKILDRLTHILPVSRKNERFEPLVSGGIATSEQVMIGILEVIPVVNKKSIDNQQSLTQIAENSYPIIAKIATVNRGLLGPLLDKFTDNSPFPFPTFISDYFCIKEQGRKNATLVLSPSGQEAWDSLEKKFYELDRRREQTGDKPTVTLGCPAMISLNRDSAIKKLWNWHVELAEQVYPRLKQVK